MALEAARTWLGSAWCARGPAEADSHKWQAKLFVKLGDAGPPNVELALPGRVLALPREQAFPKGPKVEVAQVVFAATEDFPEPEALLVHLASGGGMRACKARGAAVCRG